MTYLVDSHCHLHDREFFTAEQAEQMLKNAHKNNVKKIICIGTSHEDSLKARDFAESHEGVYWTYGTHPEEASISCSGSRPAGPSPWAAGAISRAAALRNTPKQDIDTFLSSTGDAIRELSGGKVAGGATESLTNAGANEDAMCFSEHKDLARAARSVSEGHAASSFAPSLVAIGEVGLDYHYEPYDRDAQIRLFEEMLQLATDLNLPVSFHIREAFTDFFPVIANFPKIKGVVHSFSDSKKTLRKILETTDFYIGVNGLTTYTTLPVPPLERMLLETDAPFLTPTPFRGTINEPAYIKHIGEFIATKMGVPAAQVAEITTKNVSKLFRI
ncbi:TatD family hydrolase [Candidatus Saccharibacteria bacterium]|nr:TatD family hydrolase [Candidatus Saccharibacteria bacterium]